MWRLSEPDLARKLFRSTLIALEAGNWLQQWTGYNCVDAGQVRGTGGDDIELYAIRKTRLRGLWGPDDSWDSWDEVKLLTATEFFFDVVSKPSNGRNHDYLDCGYHASAFNRNEGRARYVPTVVHMGQR